MPIKGFVVGFWDKKLCNTEGGSACKDLKMVGLRIDEDPCLPNFESPLEVPITTSKAQTMFLNANLAAYNTACAGRIMTFGTLPAGITESNKVVTIAGLTVGIREYTVTYKKPDGVDRS
jgi:hypothetical protein